MSASKDEAKSTSPEAHLAYSSLLLAAVPSTMKLSLCGSAKSLPPAPPFLAPLIATAAIAAAASASSPAPAPAPPPLRLPLRLPRPGGDLSPEVVVADLALPRSAILTSLQVGQGRDRREGGGNGG